MKKEINEKLWALWILIGSLPGAVLWIFLDSVGIAGEYASLLMGFGAIAVIRYAGCRMKNTVMIAGGFILVLIGVLSNHIGYALDVYKSFGEGWYGVHLSFAESFKLVYSSFVVSDFEGMRGFYFTSLIHGILCMLLVWIALFVYYKKSDTIEEEENGRE